MFFLKTQPLAIFDLKTKFGSFEICVLGTKYYFYSDVSDTRQKYK